MTAKWAGALVAGLACAVLLAAILLVRFRKQSSFADAVPGSHAAAIAVSSSSFANGAYVPKKFTCDGGDISPQISWRAPAGTRSMALIADDPDALIGTFTHWVVFDLPAATSALPEGMPPAKEVPGGGRQGANDFDKTGYNGPCPPPGRAHRYFFKVYALDAMLGLKAGASKPDVERAMEGHILGKGDWVGKYGR